MEGSFKRWLLTRRNRREPQDRPYYLVFTSAGTELAELAGGAGLRWIIEKCFQRAKEEEAHSWHAWHRHMTLCLTALASVYPIARLLFAPIAMGGFILAWSRWR